MSAEPRAHGDAGRWIGQTLGEKYKLTRVLGSGGMGVVYEAQHAVVGRRFAVKLLHPEIAGQPEMLQRFQREAQTAGSLESEHVAAAIDFGSAADGTPYIIMELLLGEDLGALLAREGPLPPARVVNLVIQASRGLDCAHARGVVHRDLKPENLFVCRRTDGTDLVKVLDFGVAKLRSSPGVSVTRTGSTMGTPFYMPPEQARGEKELDHRADVYALGVILYELLSGNRPHPGDSYNEILTHILMKEPVPLGERRPELPSGLVKVVHRALAKDPAARPQSVAELMAELAPYAMRAVTPNARAPNQSTVGAAVSTTEAHVASIRATQRSRTVVAGAALALAVGAAAWWATRPAPVAPVPVLTEVAPPAPAPVVVAAPVEPPPPGEAKKEDEPPKPRPPPRPTKAKPAVNIDSDDPYR